MSLWTGFPCTAPHPEPWSRACGQVCKLSREPLIHQVVSADACFSERSGSSCVKVDVAVLGSPSLISFIVSVNVKQHWIKSNVCLATVQMARCRVGGTLYWNSVSSACICSPYSWFRTTVGRICQYDRFFNLKKQRFLNLLAMCWKHTPYSWRMCSSKNNMLRIKAGCNVM